jgi:uncharacterized protein (TIGR02646 family)
VIRIQKSTTVPQKLAEDGKRKRRSHCSSYSRNPVAYQSGAKTFAFDRSIYAHHSVKHALIAAQHGKCCFCERLIGADGDVEHFRPKQAYKQATGESLQRPGYYWLAYEWENLYLSCAGCNQRHKQNLFPLENPGARATSHKQTAAREHPLFIDPGHEDPEDYLGFRGEFAFAINGNRKGQVTKDALKLNERSLPEARLQRLQLLKQLDWVIKLAAERLNDEEFQDAAKQAKDQLEKAIREDAEFSSAARWAVKTNFQFVPE